MAVRNLVCVFCMDYALVKRLLKVHNSEREGKERRERGEERERREERERGGKIP